MQWRPCGQRDLRAAGQAFPVAVVPGDAARIFEALEMPVLLDVIERMREGKSAPILAAMDPLKAKEVTASLVERRALPTLPK